MVNSNRPLAMRALIDCGTTGEFIDHEFIRAHELWTYTLPCPIGLYNVDGSPNEIGKITEAIDLMVQYKGHKSRSKFYISSVGHKAIVLGHTWLVEHNPNINWHTGEVKLTRCPDYCGQAKSNSSRPDDNISVQPIETMSDTSERIHATTTISTRLAKAARGDNPAAKLEKILPKPYLSFRDVFSKESFDELPERKQWDHVIDLKPESQPFSTKVYPMSLIKQKELDDFLKENLSSGRIHPSKSPMASPVFFVKKER